MGRGFLPGPVRLVALAALSRSSVAEMPRRTSKLELDVAELREIEQRRVDMGFATGEEVIRAALEFLASDAGRSFREARRSENAVRARIDQLLQRYGTSALFAVTVDPGGRASMTINGQPPKDLRAELRPVEDLEDVFRLIVVDDQTKLEFQPGVALVASESPEVWLTMSHLLEQVHSEGVDQTAGPAGATAAAAEPKVRDPSDSDDGTGNLPPYERLRRR